MDLRSYLERRQKQLETEIEGLRAQVAPLERELFEIRVARAACQKRSTEPLQQQLFSKDEGVTTTAEAEGLWLQYQQMKADRLSSPYFKLTIKQLVVKALLEQFTNGATAGQLLELFARGWDRDDVVRTSLSPQLSRLRQDGVIDRRDNIWFLRSDRGPDIAKTAVGL